MKSTRKPSFQQLEARNLLAVDAMDDSYTVIENETLVVAYDQPTSSRLRKLDSRELPKGTRKVLPSHDGRLLFTIEGSGRDIKTSVVDRATREVLSSIASQYEFTDFALTPDGSHLFVSDYGHGRRIPDNFGSLIHRLVLANLTWESFDPGRYGIHQSNRSAFEIAPLSKSRFLISGEGDGDLGTGEGQTLFEIDEEKARIERYENLNGSESRMAYANKYGLLFIIHRWSQTLEVFREEDEGFALITRIDFPHFLSPDRLPERPLVLSSDGEFLFIGRHQIAVTDPERVIQSFEEEIVASDGVIAIDTAGRYFDLRTGDLLGSLPHGQNSEQLSQGGSELWLSSSRFEVILGMRGVLANDVSQTALQTELVDGPDNGQLRLLPDGAFTYSPNDGFSGQDSFTYRAFASNGNSDIARVEITVEEKSEENHTPVATAKTFKIDKDDTLIIGRESGAFASGIRQVRDIADNGTVRQVAYSAEYDRVAVRNLPHPQNASGRSESLSNSPLRFCDERLGSPRDSHSGQGNHSGFRLSLCYGD